MKKPFKINICLNFLAFIETNYYQYRDSTSRIKKFMHVHKKKSSFFTYRYLSTSHMKSVTWFFKILFNLSSNIGRRKKKEKKCGVAFLKLRRKNDYYWVIICHLFFLFRRLTTLNLTKDGGGFPSKIGPI